MLSPYDIAPSPDAFPASARDQFDRSGRLRVSGFLTPQSASGLHAELTASDAWKLVINSGDKVFQIDRAAQVAMDAAKIAQLDLAIANAATDGFQYRYESIRSPDDAARRGDGPVDRFAAFMNTPATLAMLRHATGFDAIAHVDAQATLYGPGDFLTEHDDAVEGKHRLAAYVFNLAPQWRREWGGLLLFHDGEDGITGYMPGFNTLSLFRVPQRHSVSQVTTFAGNRRLSITGWLRSRAD